MGGNLHEFTTPFIQLIAEQGFKDMPSLIQDGPIKTCLLAHIAPGLGDGALGTGRHAFGVEVFNHNRAEALGQIKADPVVPVLTDAGALSAQGGDTASGLAVADRPAPTATQRLLGASLTLIERGQAGWNVDHLPGAESDCLSNTTINANATRQLCWRVMVNRKTKGNMPAVDSKADRRVVHLTNQCAGVTVANPADLRQADFGPIAVQLADLNLTTLEPEGIVEAFLARRWVSGDPFEPILVGPIQVSESLLLTGLRNSGYPVVFGSEVGQFARLAMVVDTVSGPITEVSPMISPLLKSKIVNQAADTRKLAEQLLLLWSGGQPVAVATLDHSVNVTAWHARDNKGVALPARPEGREYARALDECRD